MWTRESLRAAAWLGVAGGWAFTLLALASRDPTDPSLSVWMPVAEVHNWCGRWGALEADLLHQLLGGAAWAVLPLGAWIALRIAGRASATVSRLLAGAVATWWAAAFIGLLFYGEGPEVDGAPGGIVGAGTAGWLLAHVGVVGAYVTVVLAVLVAATLVFGIDWESLADRGVRAVEFSTPRLLRHAWDTLVLCAGRARGVVARISSGLVGWLRSLRDRAPARDLGLRGAGPELDAPEPVLDMGPEPAVAVDSSMTDAVYDAEAPMEAGVPTVVAERMLVEVELDGSAEPASTAEEPESFQAPDPVGLSSPEIRPGLLVSGGGEDIDVSPGSEETSFELPGLALLDRHPRRVGELDKAALREAAAQLEVKLADFGIRGEVQAIRPGPVITTFEYLPAPGVRVSRVVALADDIAMALKALRVRIVAPIPGRGVIGIEIPNKVRQMVWLRDLLASEAFRDAGQALPIALGRTVEGQPRVVDLAKMPHLLIGGTTGSGKSVCVNAMLMSLLYRHGPDRLRLMLIDPKMLEFELYRELPHLIHPVVTEPKLAAAALQWACSEMDQRYRTLSRWGVRGIEAYNAKVERELSDWTPRKAARYAPRGWPPEEPPPRPEKLAWLIIVIDELADLMLVASREVEESIVRLAQKARAAGIHLIVATQRPSVDVITGLIKANMPARLAFKVRSKTDGRTILDQNGAESLLGNGDMLYLPPGISDLARLHGPFVADEEVRRVADFLRSQARPDYEADIRLSDDRGGALSDEDEYDEVYDIAVRLVSEAGKASTSMIQRKLKIGYNRAARIMEVMEREGVVGPADGARPREVLVSPP